MKKYICSVNVNQIIEAETKDEAIEKFIENHDMEDLYPSCKEYRKKHKTKRRWKNGEGEIISRRIWEMGSKTKAGR